jgi:uncharacterized protein (TIGR02217 family)
MPFLEERFPLNVDYGSSFGEHYAVDIVTTRGGNEYESMQNPYPKFRFEIGLTPRTEDWMIANILDLYHRSGGRFGGFRVRNDADYSTNNYRSAPLFSDQLCIVVDAVAATYQIIRWYGDPSDPLATRRRIRKPVAGSVLVGIRAANGSNHPITAFTVDTTTGIITFDANKASAVSNITQAAQAVATVGGGHPFVVGDSVAFGTVVGMTQINTLRGSIVASDATTITVDINTTGFSAYSSGGGVATRPQFFETVTAGCYFDIPVRFESDLSGMAFASYKIMATTLSVVEKTNPDPQ